MGYYWKLLRFVKPYLLWLGFGVLCLLAASASQAVLPWIIKDVIDEVLTKKNIHMLNMISLLVLGIYVFRGFCVYGQRYLMEYVAQRVVLDLRDKLFSTMLRFRGLSYYEKNRTGGLMSYYTNDIGALQGAIVGPGLEFIRESFILTFSVISMLILHWQLTCILFISVPVILVVVRVLGKKIKHHSSRVLGQLHEFTGLMQETLSGIRVVKSFAREAHEIGRFKKQMQANFKAIMRATRAGAILTPLVEIVATGGVVILIWYGGREVIEGRLSSGSLVAFLIFAVNLSNPIKRLAHAYGKIQGALVACERVFGAIEFEPEIKDVAGAKELATIEGRVTFDRVDFAYHPGAPPVLHELSFTAEPGQMVALVGPSGAGKTTLANLLMRFYDVDGGSILVDGVDVRQVTQQSLRGQMGIVPQETLLFSGTIFDNILYGRLSATEDEVLAAAKAAHVTVFAEELPDGFDTLVGERGMSLSGGQRQRVAIARAILKDPRILILDEATSALDTESEKLVQAALDHLLPGRTSFVIAHRLSTVFKANVILVMDHGRLVEQGAHHELLEQGGLYSRLYHTQFRDDKSADGE